MTFFFKKKLLRSKCYRNWSIKPDFLSIEPAQPSPRSMGQSGPQTSKEPEAVHVWFNSQPFSPGFLHFLFHSAFICQLNHIIGPEISAKSTMPTTVSSASSSAPQLYSSTLSPAFTLPSSQFYKPTRLYVLPRPPINGVSCVSNRPRRKSGSKPDKSEAWELVRVLMRNFSEERPIVSTLNKYVKVVRTEHCFLLFEELGKGDKWLQCLEVCFLTLCLSFIFRFSESFLLRGLLPSLGFVMVLQVYATSHCLENDLQKKFKEFQ